VLAAGEGENAAIGMPVAAFPCEAVVSRIATVPASNCLLKTSASRHAGASLSGRDLPALTETEPKTDDPDGCRIVDGVEALPLPNLAPKSGSARGRATIDQEHDRPHPGSGPMPDLPSGTVTFLFTDSRAAPCCESRHKCQPCLRRS
jgi:hypothetical protein